MKCFFLAVLFFALLAMACAQDSNTVTVTKTEPVQTVQTVQTVQAVQAVQTVQPVTITQVATNQFPQVSGGTLLLSTSSACGLNSFWLAF